LLRTGGYGYILGESVAEFILTNENAVSWLTKAQDIGAYVSTGWWTYYDMAPDN
jgi:hypothetical protein